MLLLSEAVGEAEEPVARQLLRFNIRWAEQFLGMMQNPTAAERLASALERPVEELRALALRLHAQHPDLAVPARSGARYGMGYGGRAENEGPAD